MRELLPHPRPVPYLPWPDWAPELGPRLERADASRIVLTVALALGLARTTAC